MSTGLVVGGSHTPAGARAPGGRGPLTQPCPPSPLLVRDTELGISFPRVGFPAVPWGGGGDGHCQIARPRRPESHEAGSRWNSGSKRANGWLSDRGRGAGVFAERPPVAAAALHLRARRRLPARGADSRGGRSKSCLHKIGPRGGPWRRARPPGAARRAHARPRGTEPTDAVRRSGGSRLHAQALTPSRLT